MSEDDAEVTKSVLSWIHSNVMDDVAEYVNCGRRYKDHGTQALKEMWVHEFKKFVAELSRDGRAFQYYKHIECELNIRNEDVPSDLVTDDIDVMTGVIEAAYKSVCSDEDKYDEFSDRFFTDYLDFVRKSTNSSN